MSNSTWGENAWTLDWETIAALCPKEWGEFVRECKSIILPLHPSRQYSANDWLYPVNCFLQWQRTYREHGPDKAWDTELGANAEGKTYEGMACRVMGLWDAVVTRFKEKTRPRSWFGQKDGLTLYACAKEDQSTEEYDDIQPNEHFFVLEGTHVESPAFTQFKRDYPAARPEQKSWTHYG